MNEQTSHIKDKQRILRGHKLRRAVIGDSVGLLVPPLVAALRPRNLISSTLENEDVLNVSAALECRVNDNLGGNSFPTAAPFVRRKDDAALAVIDAVTKSLRGKASKYDRVDSTNARTGEKGSDSLPCHGKIDRDGITFLDTKGLEYIGNAADLMQQLGVGDLAAFGWLISFIDNGALIIEITCPK